MKISYNWLTDYIDCGLAPAELADRLTQAGLEVEKVTAVEPGLDDILVGEVLSVEAHPRADRLSLCGVSDGKTEFTVVCGAPNVRAGARVSFARPGARMPDGSVIKASKLRGVVSEGMLCSEKELGLGADAAGIMILDGSPSPGAPLVEVLRLRDWILDIGVTPNRPDCLSVIGVARELSALLNKPVKEPSSRLVEAGGRTRDHVGVTVENGELCPRYSARLIRGVKVGPSPFWMRARLGMAGLRAVNNVVDTTNYVLMERGQPLHAFDHDKINGGAVVVRLARPGEGIVTIDGKERRLEEGMLVIADSAGPVAVAGVMGGGATEVGEGTTSILLESAYFDPRSVRRTSKRLGLSSDSSYRFERGVDYEGVVPASHRAAGLIAEITGAEVFRGIVDENRGRREPRRLTLRIPRMNSILNTRLTPGKARGCLERLGMEVEESGEKELGVTPPSYRVDIRREIDLVEEVARLYGYDRIREVPPLGIVSPAGEPAGLCGREKLREAACSAGFSEAISLSFVGEDEIARLMPAGGDPLGRAVRLRNPVSEEFSLLRTSLLPPLMRCLSLNAGRGNSDIRLFELGTVFIRSPDGAGVEERGKLALAAMGSVARPNWCTAARRADFFSLKGVIEGILRGSGADFTVEKDSPPYCHPERAARLLLDGRQWGWMGELHPRLTAAYGLEGPVIFAEIDSEPLLEALARPRRFTPLPRFPAVKRDIAVVAGGDLESETILRTAREASPGLIDSVEIFDVYSGAPIPPGKKGIAVSVLLRSREKTLREKDIAAAMNSIYAALKGIGCEIR